MQCNLNTQRFTLHHYSDMFYEIILFTEQCIFYFYGQHQVYLRSNVYLNMFMYAHLFIDKYCVSGKWSGVKFFQ